jgi:hypothetical protein
MDEVLNEMSAIRRWKFGHHRWLERDIGEIAEAFGLRTGRIGSEDLENV